MAATMAAMPAMSWPLLFGADEMGYVSSRGGVCLRSSGRPPFLPFSRAAAALAGLVLPFPACPPMRPSATA